MTSLRQRQYHARLARRCASGFVAVCMPSCGCVRDRVIASVAMEATVAVPIAYTAWHVMAWCGVAWHCIAPHRVGLHGVASRVILHWLHRRDFRRDGRCHGAFVAVVGVLIIAIVYGTAQ